MADDKAEKVLRMTDVEKEQFTEITEKAKAFQVQFSLEGEWNRKIHTAFLISWLRGEGIDIPAGPKTKDLLAKLQLGGLGDNSSQFGAAAGLRTKAAKALAGFE